MSVLAIVAAVAGTALSALGSYSANENSANAAEAQADIDTQNAAIARTAGEDARWAGFQEAAKIETAGKQFAGSQIAAMGSSGMEVGSGTNIDIQMDTARGVAADATVARTDAKNQQEAYEETAKLYELEAEGNEDLASYYRSAGILTSSAIILNGASSAYKSYQTS